jgi:hypothetical protein
MFTQTWQIGQGAKPPNHNNQAFHYLQPHLILQHVLVPHARVSTEDQHLDAQTSVRMRDQEGCGVLCMNHDEIRPNDHLKDAIDTAYLYINSVKIVAIRTMDGIAKATKIFVVSSKIIRSGIQAKPNIWMPFLT